MRSLQIEGHPSTSAGLHAALVATATAHVDDIHRAKCTPVTPIMIARMDCHGVGEDLNQVVRMLAVAITQRRQLVLLPPPPAQARGECKLPASVVLGATQPWHWLAGQSIPLESLLVLSSCHVELLRREPKLMQALARSNAGNATATALSLGASSFAAAARESASLWRSHLAVSKHVPRIFQRQGLLWWFQILTTYIVRIRGPLAHMLQVHPAMQPFILSGAPTEDAGADLRWRGWTVSCGMRYCDGIGPGWTPTARFDAGLHLRIGDSCKSGLARYSLHVRRCDVNLTMALQRFRTLGLHNGSIFVASDSQQVIDQVAAGATWPLNASYLKIDRVRFETSAGTEKIGMMTRRLNSLLEALMDALLLSRTPLIAGKMMSNFPRFALQMRVQMPARRHTLHRGHAAYIALDDRPWCTRTSCREPFATPRDQQLASRRELTRNPIIA